ncbi:MAG: indole-3-glycerol-phosphate synthase [Sandaracinaceae bacterium]|nr:indole-3-glycerol-phosphate synthase [Sandaracinaceae bacterium]
MSYLGPILARKRREIARRARHLAVAEPGLRRGGAPPDLARPAGARPRVIAEVKFRSPSAGAIRPWAPGEAVRVARGYAAGGADAISVLCDGPGFGGSPLALRRVARAVAPVPVLFKEFVLDALQLDLAVRCGASLVLLLVNALDDATLRDLVRGCAARGLAPLVEAASEQELERALATDARHVGINARDLRTFALDPRRAAALVEKIPKDRVAVYMSGVQSADELRAAAASRADAVLVGSGLMAAPDPGARLAAWLEELGR